MPFNNTVASIALAALLAGCVHPSQNRYGSADVGMNAVVGFGTVVSIRQVEIIGQGSGAGATVGLGAGLAAGSQFGSGSGSLGAALAGALIGAAVGAAAEQAMQDRQGVEYVVTLEDGETQSIVQDIARDDVPLRVGQRVMLQTSGTYRRVLSAEALPEEIDQPKGVKTKKKAKDKAVQATDTE